MSNIIIEQPRQTGTIVQKGDKGESAYDYAVRVDGFVGTEAQYYASVEAHRIAADADTVQTALDRIATGADAVQTALDVIATSADADQTALDRIATAADRVQTGLDVIATASDRVQTGLDRDATGRDKMATAADRVQTGLDVITSTTQAGIATTKSGEASTSKDTATTQSGIATTQAGIATTKAGEANTSKDTATTQAGIATTKANEALASKDTATTQAGIATTQAGIATAAALNVVSKEDSANKVTSISGSSTDVQYPTAKLLYDRLATKQATLTNPITGTGASGQVSFFNGTTTETGDNGLFWDNTNKRLTTGSLGFGIAQAGLINVLSSTQIVIPSIYISQTGNFTASPPELNFTKMRNGLGSLGPGESLGSIYFKGSNGSALLTNASISSNNDGAVNSGSLSFGVNSLGTFTNQLNIKSSGNVGIGTASPTAVLHIKAGTATASTAPIKLTSGTLLTTPEAGAIEFDGTNYYATNSIRNTIAFKAVIPQSIAYSATTTINYTLGSDTNIAALTGNLALVFSNLTDGARGEVLLTQDATGSRLLSSITASGFTIKYRGNVSTLTTTASASDLVRYTVKGTVVLVDLNLNYV